MEMLRKTMGKVCPVVKFTEYHEVFKIKYERKHAKTTIKWEKILEN